VFLSKQRQHLEIPFVRGYGRRISEQCVCDKALVRMYFEKELVQVRALMNLCFRCLCLNSLNLSNFRHLNEESKLGV